MSGQTSHTSLPTLSRFEQAYFPNAVQDEVLARLRYLVEHHHRLGLLLGPSGSGKSTVLQTLADELSLQRALDIDLPDGVTAQVRSDGEQRFVFIMNFSPDKRRIDLGDRRMTDLLTGETVSGVKEIESFGVMVVR